MKSLDCWQNTFKLNNFLMMPVNCGQKSQQTGNNHVHTLFVLPLMGNDFSSNIRNGVRIFFFFFAVNIISIISPRRGAAGWQRATNVWGSVYFRMYFFLSSPLSPPQPPKHFLSTSTSDGVSPHFQERLSTTCRRKKTVKLWSLSVRGAVTLTGRAAL